MFPSVPASLVYSIALTCATIINNNINRDAHGLLHIRNFSNQCKSITREKFGVFSYELQPQALI